jgi:hypothetical protein
MTLLEPDVTLTDFGLAIECGAFAAWLRQCNDAGTPLRLEFVVFFAALALAASFGGISHGFFSNHQSWLYVTVWNSGMIALGTAAFASWAIGARLILSDRAAMRVTAFAGLLFAAHVAVILFVSRSFAVAIVHYLPATIFLLAAFALAYRRRGDVFLLAGIAGLLLTVVASGAQQARIGLHPVYFNHNALYHLIQAFALLLIFWAARGLLKPAHI